MKVIKVEEESILFENGMKLYSYHDQDCCESHYLSFSDLSISDFEGLEFDLSNDRFIKKVDGYGIELIPTNGHSIKVPGYGSNNGYYSTSLNLLLSDDKGNDFLDIDISECQEISD